MIILEEIRKKDPDLFEAIVTFPIGEKNLAQKIIDTSQTIPGIISIGLRPTENIGYLEAFGIFDKSSFAKMWMESFSLRIQDND